MKIKTDPVTREKRVELTDLEVVKCLAVADLIDTALAQCAAGLRPEFDPTALGDDIRTWIDNIKPVRPTT